jgi:hypothetical protein
MNRNATEKPPSLPVGTPADLNKIVDLIIGKGQADIDRDHLAECVLFVVEDLLSWLRDVHVAPTKAQELYKLKQCREAALKLLASWSSMHPLTRETLLNDLKRQTKPLRATRRFMELANRSPAEIDKACTPNPGASMLFNILNWEGTPSRHPLQAIVLAGENVEDFYRSKGAYQGGPSNLLQRLGPSPNDWVAQRAAEWVLSAQGITAVTGSIPGGCIYKVALAVWQFATGRTPESSSFINSVKRAAKLVREDHQRDEAIKNATAKRKDVTALE